MRRHPGGLRLLLLPFMALTLAGCDKLAAAFVDLLVAVIFLGAMGVINLLALIGIGASVSVHSKGRRSWIPLVLAAVLIAGCMLLITMGHMEKPGGKLEAFLLHGTMLPVVWLIGAIVSPLTVVRGLPEDPTTPVRRTVGAVAAVAILGWFGFVTISTGSLQATYIVLTTPPPPPQPPEPVEIEALHIGDGHGCAETNLGLYCWPDLQHIEPDGDFAMSGTQICTGDFKSVQCRDLKENKRLRKIPHRVRSDMALGPGGGCLNTWDHSTLCWHQDGPVHAIGKTTTLWSLAVGRDQACGQFQSPTIGCWSLSDTDAPTPAPVLGVEHASNVVAGDDFFCAEDGGRLKCWGAGRASLSGPSDEPAEVAVAVGKPDLKDYSVGAAHACGIDKQQALWCWGSATGGALGNGVFAGTVIEPVKVELPGAVKWVHAGHHATCIELLHTVEHYCWGQNDGGQLPVEASTTTACGATRCVPKPSKVALRIGKHES